MHSKVYEDICVDAKNSESKKKTPIAIDTTKIDIESAIIKFIVKERLPISKVDSTHLNELIQGTW